MILAPGEYDCISLWEPWAWAIFHSGKISLWEPWAWAIFHAGKTVENRTWHTTKYGTILLHTAKNRRDVWPATRYLEEVLGIIVPTEQLVFGCILGAVNLVSCHYSEKENDWGAANRFHWRVEDPTLLPRPIPWRGQQGFFKVTLTREDLRGS